MSNNEKMLTKTACINKKNECNFEDPYSYLEFNKIISKKNLSQTEIKMFLSFRVKCDEHNR